MTTRSLKIRKKHLIFSTLVSLATIQLINLGLNYDEQIIQGLICDTLPELRKWLSDSFDQAESHLSIVSAYLSLRAIQADNIQQKILVAIDRGVKVYIYFDNEKIKIAKNVNVALDLLSEAGAKVILLRNIHTKFITIDENSDLDGTFNWLSGERTKQEYVDHNTCNKFTNKIRIEKYQRILDHYRRDRFVTEWVGRKLKVDQF